jgi:MFS family permease
LWKGLFVFCVAVSVSSLLSAFSPNYETLLILRGVVGFCISGVTQKNTFYVEFLPTRSRGKCIVFMEIFWFLGTVAEILLAMLLLGHLKQDWHWLLGFTAVPVFIDLLAFLVVPESPLYYVAVGHTGKAQKILEKVAKDNGKKLPPGQLVSRGEKRWIELLRKDLRESKEITNEPVEDNEIVSDNSELSHLDTSPLIETEIQFAKVGYVLMLGIW